MVAKQASVNLGGYMQVVVKSCPISGISQSGPEIPLNKTLLDSTSQKSFYLLEKQMTSWVLQLEPCRASCTTPSIQWISFDKWLILWDGQGHCGVKEIDERLGVVILSPLWTFVESGSLWTVLITTVAQWLKLNFSYSSTIAYVVSIFWIFTYSCSCFSPVCSRILAGVETS